MAAAAAPPAAAAAPEPFPDPMPDPFPIHLSSRVNLDHLFAFETVKSLGEPMTPFRVR